MTVNDYLAKRDAEWTRPVYEAPRLVGRLHPEPDAVRRAPRRVCERRDLWDELRVRVRLPQGQHGGVARGNRAAEPRVRDRGRGRLDPDRRGANAADHLRRARDGRRHVLPVRSSGQDPRGAWPRRASRRRARTRPRPRAPTTLRREVQDRLARADRDRGGRARARHRQHVRPEPRPPRQPPDAGAQSASLYKRDVDYVVQEGEVKIVDEFTGRIMEGRRWSEGLHQAIEAKEGVRIREENVTCSRRSRSRTTSACTRSSAG